VPSITTQANITISRKFLHENFTQLSHPKPEKSGTAPQERKVSCGQGSLGTQLTMSEQKRAKMAKFTVWLTATVGDSFWSDEI